MIAASSALQECSSVAVASRWLSDSFGHHQTDLIFLVLALGLWRELRRVLYLGIVKHSGLISVRSRRCEGGSL